MYASINVYLHRGILDVTQILEKYPLFVVIEVKIGHVMSFHNVNCVFVCFKLNIALWYFIIINF